MLLMTLATINAVTIIPEIPAPAHTIIIGASAVFGKAFKITM
ncbi:hypothetical protein R9X47_24670 [Wukongibacter baidiensis]